MAWHTKLSLTAIFACAALLVEAGLAEAGLAAPAFATPSESADVLFAHAKAEAKQEHKRVLLVFSASWCGPCKFYERFLEDPQMKPIEEKAFVIQRIHVGERKSDPRYANTPGGVKLRSALGAVDEPGFPFLVITDETGRPIVNSYRDGSTCNNVGYPDSPEEIDWYVAMLKRAAPSLSPADMLATRTWLQKHTPH